jgi:hypothetical protein
MQHFCANQDGTVVALLTAINVVAIRQRANMLDEIVWIKRIYPASAAKCSDIGHIG